MQLYLVSGGLVMRYGVDASLGNRSVRFLWDRISIRATPFDPRFSHLDQVPPVLWADGVSSRDGLQCGEPMIDIPGQLPEDQGYRGLAEADDRPVSRVLGHR